jgi:hypothetical protein
MLGQRRRNGEAAEVLSLMITQELNPPLGDAAEEAVHYGHAPDGVRTLVHQVAELDHGQVFGKSPAVRISTEVAEGSLESVGVALNISDERDPQRLAEELGGYRGSRTRRGWAAHGMANEVKNST